MITVGSGTMSSGDIFDMKTELLSGRWVYGIIYNDYAQNDIVKIIDSTGTTVVEYIYDSWGKALSVTGSAASSLGLDQPFRYRGYVYDTETGWYYLQSRYYDPNTCRFISADVLLSTGQGVIGHNSFAYCMNNPIERKDPTGNASVINTWNYTCTDCPHGNSYKPILEHNFYFDLAEYAYMNTSVNGENLSIDISKSNGLIETMIELCGYTTVSMIIAKAALRKYIVETGKPFKVKEITVWREVNDHMLLSFNNLATNHTNNIDIAVVYSLHIYSDKPIINNAKSFVTFVSNAFQAEFFYHYAW